MDTKFTGPLNGGPAYRPLKSAFGKCLRDFRQQRGWSQSELGRRSGVDRSFISRIEASKRASCSQQAIAKLAQGLNLTHSETTRLYTAANLTYNDEQASLALVAQQSLLAHGYAVEVVEYVDKFWKTLLEMADQMQSAVGEQAA